MSYSAVAWGLSNGSKRQDGVIFILGVQGLASHDEYSACNSCICATMFGCHDQSPPPASVLLPSDYPWTEVIYSCIFPWTMIWKVLRLANLPLALHVTDMDKFSPEAQSILASKEMRVGSDLGRVKVCMHLGRRPPNAVISDYYLTDNILHYMYFQMAGFDITRWFSALLRLELLDRQTSNGKPRTRTFARFAGRNP